MNQATKKIILLVFLLLAASCNQKKISDKAVPSPAYDYSHQLKVGGLTLMVEVASDSAKMQLGLSNRESMADNQGMLFDFGADAKVSPSFWMKGMKFNLDLIWIYKNKIIGITADVLAPDVSCSMLHVPCTLPLYSPPSPVDSVLEVNAGWSGRNGIKVGDEVKLIEQNLKKLNDSQD